LAPLFIEHAGIAPGEEVLEVGCGTGSLTFALAAAAALGGLTAIDYSPIYLAAAQAKAGGRSIRFEQGDGCALRFPDASFDRTLSMLVLPSVLPHPEWMIAEMRRVTRPGGVAAAAFWDSPGGTPHQRMLWDIAAVLDDDARAARAYCLSGECSPDFKRCLTAGVPVASLISARATAPLPNPKSMLTDVGPVELWATRQRRPSAAANPQGSLHRNRWRNRSRHC